MPRTARVVVPGVAHHVIQRGNNRQAVFFTDNDRRVYLTLLADHCQRLGVRVRGWCLMTNHVHLIMIPDDAEGLALAVGRTHWRYTQYINRLHGRHGHLWQNRFHSCALDDEHEEFAIRYAERNPVRARMLRLPWKYPWSSAAVHCGMTKDAIGLLDDPALWRRRYPGKAWERILQQPEDETMLLRMRKRTFNGRPLGSDRFIAKLEGMLNRRLRDPKMGRPSIEAAKGKGKRTRGRGPRTRGRRVPGK